VINSNKTKSYRNLGSVNVSDLKRRVEALSDSDWQIADSEKPNKFNALGRAQHLVFRFPKNLKSHLESYETSHWSGWKDIIEPIIEKAVQPFNYSKGYFPRIMLAKLPSKSEVKPHVDKSPSAQYPHKIHIPIFTNNEVFFYANGESIHMEVGQVYEVNNNQLHWAINNGNIDRIHLIFEYYSI
jgi:aspartyl/asparaginyl beta-hydroxylase